ncbi:MAG: CCA tRNA nucleotidyltransferase [Verrucomicrobiae bacterium]|nr:CCA tRNA nucleotidyltransferase [Verrucomicrobiae bacterium]
MKIVRRLREAGHLAYFAGGCVRDRCLGREPLDYDVATTATPQQVQALFTHTIPVGAQFGVIIVHEDGHDVQVAMFRTESDYRDGRHPDVVRPGTPEEDARRRDFTINGLFEDPVSGEVIDYVGGRADLDARVVRCIGDPQQRFAEDKLRLLRAIRLAANLDFTIAPETWEALRAQAQEIRQVSIERVRDELLKILTRPGAARGLQLLSDSGLLDEILPEVAAMHDVPQPAEYHPEGDVFTHVCLMLELMAGKGGESRPLVEPVLALAVLLHDVGKPRTLQQGPDRIRFPEHDRVGAEMAETILRRLRLPNRVIEDVALCVAEHMRFQHVQQMRPGKLHRLLTRPTFAVELELHRLDCLASHRNLENYEFLRRKAEELAKSPPPFEPWLGGDDVLTAGVRKGPLVGQILEEAEELQLEGRLRSRAEALAWLRARVANLSGSPEAKDTG